jgi:uroporphyrinogen decarboxylase
MNDRSLLRALRGETVSPPPIWLMRQAGRYLPEYRAVRAKAGDFLTMCYTPEYATEVTLQPIRRYGFDAAIVFADILLVPHALGVGLRFAEGEGPKLDPIRDTAGLARLSDAAAAAKKLAPVYETLSALRAKLPTETALIGFAGAPWTVATYVVEGGGSSDQAEAKLWAHRDARGFGQLIDVLTEATILYLDAQVAAGADALQLFESWASGLSPAMFERVCIRPVARIVAAMKERHPKVPLIGFPRGSGVLAARYASETGIDGVSLDPSQPIDWMRAQVGPRVALQGNLDPFALAAGGDAMAAAVREILRTAMGGPFIFNLGHGIIPQTNPDHVQALVRLVRDGGR